MLEEALIQTPAMMAQAGPHEGQGLLVPCNTGHTAPADHDSKTNDAVDVERPGGWLELEASVFQGPPRLSSWPALATELSGPPPLALAHDNSQHRRPLLMNHRLQSWPARSRGTTSLLSWPDWPRWPPMAWDWNHRPVRIARRHGWPRWPSLARVSK